MRIPRRNVKIILAVAFLILVLLTAAPLVSHRALGDYTDPTGPLHQGAYAGDAGDFDGALRVVTWNMFYGDQLEQAIAALEEAPELQDADILLLQEINAVGVETIAKRLNYNYIFFPAILDHHRPIEYGDAILSKWPITNPTKLILPIFIPGWLESRISASARISVGGRAITIYSTHLDITWMIFMLGESQAEFLSRAAGGQDHSIILGGDFNTWNPASIVNLDQQIAEIGLKRLSKGAGYTFEWASFKLTLDHIYSSFGEDYRSGVYRQTNASDHYPVWAEIRFSPDQDP